MHDRNLPQDVLFCICEELANLQDFGTLFNFSKQRNMVAKWALQWKSIIRSCLGQTLYPYGLYIRVLDLSNLSDLLDDTSFRDHLQRDFFAGEMAQFLKAQETPVKRKTRKGARSVYNRLTIPLILEAVGESITSYVTESASQSHSTVALEDLSGDINTTSLLQWTGRLSKLRSLTIWDGGALTANVATSIATNCFEFDDLSVYKVGDDDDSDLASFFSALTPNTLRSFTAQTADGVGPETLLALNHHAGSLKTLKLHGVKPNGIKNLHHLQGCNLLETLDLTADRQAGFIDLKATENDVYLEVIAWLRKCEQLRELLLQGLNSAPSILTEVCLSNNTKLQKLVVTGYPVIDNQDFHRALSHQTSLEHLELKADAEGGFRDDIDIPIHSITRLPKLKHLNLVPTSEYFRTPDITNLAPHMKNLEELWFMGYDVDDSIWPSLSSLRQLRVLNILALSSFTLDGILAFISTLQRDTNHGLLLAVMNQNPVHAFTDTQQGIIRRAIEEKVNGTFEFVLFREEDSASEELSD
ncbi:hypothetical protein LOCC1_G000186 [Lachnellula occidentalis]|uniref:Uncharacterized protein n=1 Tax=Lachnellula occidentalis TaxID=215460 RepID=A0A8H8UIN6_9HELO|nr:hypothetical protein LOCC1_G000186 [Lachnellula occidentalis]